MAKNKRGIGIVGQVIILSLVFLFAVAFGFIGGALSVSVFAQPESETVEVEIPLEVTRRVEVETEVEVTREVTIEREVEVPVEIEVTRIVEVTPEVPETEGDTAGETVVLPEGLTAEDLALFFEVWENIEQDFDGDLPSRQELNYAIINGAIESLDDQYTRFLEPDVAERMREDMDGSFEGIGAFVRENDEGFVEIVRPMAGQPADLAGVRAGDLIITVDGENVVGQSLDEIITKVRGPRDTEVLLGLAREGREELIEVTITRARIEIPIVESEMLADDIAYLHLTSFNAVSQERVMEALETMLAQNPRALIFDLRDNPGGFLDESVDIADIFLPESVVLYERSRSGLDRTFEADDGDIGEEIPLVVLVNAGSASASELVAGALRDNDRAVLIGEQTFGKGSVQQLRYLSDGSELRVTIARWYTPDNVNINAEGITPDIVIELDPEAELGGEEDTQLQRAIDYILEGE